MKWDIKKMTKNVVRRSQHLPDHRLMHPSREWTIGLVIFFILAGVGSWYEFSSFNYYNNVNERTATDSYVLIDYHEGSTGKVLKAFSERADAFNSIKEQYGRKPVLPPVPVETAPTEESPVPTATVIEEGNTENTVPTDGGGLPTFQ